MPIHGYPGGVISATAPTISPTSASGVWTLDDQLQNAANWPSQSNIARSLRFNSADSAYLSRTPASAGNRRTWTLSFWMKRGQLTASDNWRIFACRPASGTYTLFDIINTGSGAYPNAFSLVDNNGTNLATTAIYRDPSAWYHVVLAVDTTQATSSNRVKLYVNGSQVTAFSSATYPTQNLDTQINTANAHNIGRDPNTGASFFDGYLTDIYLIDGSALTPSSFGYTDSNGIWQPNSYTGSYGTNGFWLNFDDNSGITATTLGKDSSGNGNNWTPNNFSVTAGAGNDSLVDSPSNYGTDTGVGGEVRGNYCTWNPLNIAGGALANGNLDLTNTAGGRKVGTIAVSSGKWYWEVAITSAGSGMVGLMSPANVVSTGAGTNFVGGAANEYGYYTDNGQKYTNATATSYGATYGSGDVIGIALNLDAGEITFYKNGSSQGVAFTGVSGTLAPAASAGGGSGASMTANFGQRPFAYTAPAGFKALCSTNLPTPTIQKGGSYFNTVLWTGDGSYPRTITGVGFQPDFVWTKSRSSAFSHISYDVVRGTGTTKSLSQNETSAEGANSSNANLTAFTSDGFTVDSTTGTNVLNKNLDTFVAWNWKAGGTGVSNTAGSITSTISANQTAGFSVVTYTGTGANATVGHGLGAAPSMIIVKKRSAAGDNWNVYHAAIGSDRAMRLNTAFARDIAPDYWNNTNPTSSVFTVGTLSGVNGSGATFVAYCFAAVLGYSAFGSYTGNGSTDGPFVYTGFRPAWLLMKRVDTAGFPWVIIDSKRNTYNPENLELYPNVADAEASGGTIYIEDFLSNGFKIRQTDGTWNASGGTYLYAAFAENPFKIARAR